MEKMPCTGGKDPSISGSGRHICLMKVHGEKDETCTFVNPINGSIVKRNITEIQGKRCFGCFGEWWLLIDVLTSECFFWNQISYSKIHLPPFQEGANIFGKFSLSAYPDSPENIVTCVQRFHNYVLFCRMYDKEWTKLPISHFEDGQYNTGISLIYKGRLFILGRMEETVVLDITSLVEGCIETIVSYSFHDYPTPFTMHEYLVESCDSLFCVRVHRFGNAQNVVHMDVYRLFEPSSNEEEQELVEHNEVYWDRVPDIGDQAFMLSRMHGTSLSAKEFVGVEPNCIYLAFSCSDGERLYRFCLKDQTYSFSVLLPEDITPPFIAPAFMQLFWSAPLLGMENIEFEGVMDIVELSKDTDNSEENQDDNQITKRWADLPIDLVIDLFKRLSFVDCLRGSAVCKSWELASDYIPKSNSWPWLLHSPNIANGVCKIFDPVNEKEYTLTIESLSAYEQLVFHSSRDGWVVVSEGNEVFILNPLTEEALDVPTLGVFDYQCISFIGVPTSPDCQVVVFYFRDDDELVAIHSWHSGQDDWTKITPEINIQFSGTMNKPVLYDGELYCLDRRGQLGVFNPDELTWRVHTKPEPIYSDVPYHAYACCSLLELNNDLVAVFRADNSTDAVRVFKLDKSKMTWIKVENLGDATLFVGYRNSLAIVGPAPLRSYQNRMYLPKFAGRDHRKGVFYSMDDQMYHPKLYGVEEPTTYVWFKPDTTITYATPAE